MGIFSTNRYNSAESNNQMMFEAAEGYHGDIGFAIAAIESYQNDMAIFNGVISSDFQEATLVHEGASADEVYILQEGVLSNAWEKIKEFFKKLWEKIKGIFKAFFAKAEGALSKDTKSFYNKYEEAINKKNLADFEVKCRVPKNKDVILKWRTGFNFNVNDSVSKEELDDFDEEEYFETRSDTATGIKASKKEFEEKYFEAVFEEENDVKFTVSDLTGTDSWVKEALTNTNRLGAIKQANKDLESTIAKIIGMIDDEIKKVKKADGNKK
ncbi:MAG: hypothetical protein J6Y02_10810 [Pseudobutyrivibrio sp.]|nr:hypothetical protein [Pseudobutyrivibrio sp.]